MNRKGAIAIGVLAVAAVVLEVGAATMYLTDSSMKRATREQNKMMLIHLAEAGLQTKSNSLWTNFKSTQKFDNIDTNTQTASTTNPVLCTTTTLSGNQKYQVAVVGYSTPDTYTRDLTILSVGWLDYDNDNTLDANEPRRAVRSVMRYALTNSKVFDYCYFVNNYGWMNGFSQSELIVNGDMRANGNFDFSGGTPTINGSVYASPNSKLDPPADGVVNITPNQWTNSYYEANANSRCRQAYNPSKHGDKKTKKHNKWRDLVYDNEASKEDDVISGAIVGDKNGIKTYSGTLLDPEPSSELPMPDLSDLSRYTTLSNGYIDNKATYNDGTANPNYNQPAYIETWNTTTSAYVRISTNGVVTGTKSLIGYQNHPIKIHGPVTFTDDCIIKGYVQGQGTIYTGRNIHIIGSIKYTDPPDFRGTDPDAIDNSNEKKTMLGLAARASIIMGNTSAFTDSTPLQYMIPPFTHGRYDDNGNWIPPFNAKETDYSGKKRYQSTIGDTALNSLCAIKTYSTDDCVLNNIDAVLYTNFLGGGVLGGSNGGVTFNGSIISKDEAMVLKSLPFKINYDNRIKEKSLDNKPLIDIDLPRTPSLKQMTWQEVSC